MVEEVLKNIYRCEIPLPKNPLKSVNSYLIRGQERDLIVDTGMNRDECMMAMQLCLEELRVDLSKTQFFITHFHVDHLGLLARLITERSVVYFNQPDAERFRSKTRWDDIIHFTLLHGFPEDELRTILNYHPAYQYGLKTDVAFTILRDGDTLPAGNYVWKCIETPGHSKGHMCLYEPNEKILLSGDHILKDITPTIQLRSEGENPLKDYLSSLEKIFRLDVRIVLPGHRSVFDSCQERIRELEQHHEERSREVLSILERGCQNAFQVASKMSWDISYASWDLFPVMQKWFATGETIAHLKYLEERGRVRREPRGQKTAFCLSEK